MGELITDKVDSTFHPSRDGKWVSTLWLSNNTNSDGRMLGLQQPIYTGGLKGQVCSLAYELAATWRWPTLALMNHSELSHMAGAVDDSIINIIVLIIIIIIIVK